MSSQGDEIRAEAVTRITTARSVVQRGIEAMQTQIGAGDGPWRQWLDVAIPTPAQAQRADVADFVHGVAAAVLCNAASVIDAADALVALLKLGTQAQLSALVVSRTALEASANAHHLLSPVNVDAEEFVSRALEMAWQNWSDERDVFPMGVETGLLDPKHERRSRAGLTAATRANGWSPDFSKRGDFVQLKTPQGRGRGRPASATERVRRACEPDGLYAWRITSGAAHGRPWMQMHEVQSPDAPMPGAAALTATTTWLEAGRVILAAAAAPFGLTDAAVGSIEVSALKYPGQVGLRLREMMTTPADDHPRN